MDGIQKIIQIVMPLEGGIIFVFFYAVFITSLLEKEKRPAVLSLLISLTLPVPFLLTLIPGIDYPEWISLTISIIPPAILFLFFFPFRGKQEYSRPQPPSRFDERDTMFSRRTLVPGTERYEEYYARRPGNKPLDNNFRRKPGLLKSGTTYYDPILFAAANSMFDKVIEELHPRVEGEPAPNRLEVMADQAAEPDVSGSRTAFEISETLIRMAKDWGAYSAGITPLKDYHVYSAGGRGDRYGDEFEVEHKYALALTIEMDYDMMRTAPAAPTVVESARQYLQSGMIAVQLAEFIRTLGYPARAHIDGNYKVICPLVARDAGLGEIGRMGLLMTPGLGPRCRIAVVTTDLPLVASVAGISGQATGDSASRMSSDPSVIDFCRRCEKCASVCPSQSIPLGDKSEMDGVKRWKLDSESCFTYWCQAGTDCGRCMIVCPYSHPDNWFHRFIRFGIRNNFLFRRLALPLDDLFYGQKPKPRKL